MEPPKLLPQSTFSLAVREVSWHLCESTLAPSTNIELGAPVTSTPPSPFIFLIISFLWF